MQTTTKPRTQRLPLAIIVALVDSRDWADACTRYPHLFDTWTMDRYYDQRGELLCCATDAEHERR